jgi:asparagine synthase (glutamine-hydrolysing)
MCGICGIYSTAGSAVPPAIEKMTDALVHRGPDDQGEFSEGPAAIGMRRLSIIGVGNGHQPIFNEDRSVALVMNGEIYNYRELKSELLERGHRFSTDSDTEVIAHLYEEVGEDFVERLRGMFAIALWDRAAERMLLVRDRPGKKPLYWAEHDGHIVFASEIKSIHASGLVPKEIDPRGLRAYLATGFVAGERTLFAHVKKLPAGHLMTLSAEGRQIRRYWDLPTRGDTDACSDTLDQAADRVRHLLEESVRRRLVSEVPLGAFLSGGTDSSAIVAIMREHLDHPVQTFSVGFAKQEIDESPHARRVAQRFGTEHREARLTGCNLSVLLEINRFNDEPAGDPAAVPTYSLAKFARRTVTVALTGEGGDEIFAGYRHHLHCARIAAIERTVPGFRALARAAGALEPLLGGALPWNVWKGLWLAGLAPEERARGWSAAFTDRDLEALMSPSTCAEATVEAQAAPIRALSQRASQLDPVGQLLYVDARSGLADQLLMKVDKMGMAASLEARCPLLDQELVEYAASLPTSMKHSAEGSKVVFRRALRGLVPDDILDRPKQGFDVPLADWLMQDLRAVVEVLVLAEDSPLYRWLEHDAVAELWSRFETGRDERLAFQLWRLLNLAVWLELHWPTGRLEELQRAPAASAPAEAVFFETTPS